jgi:uncharacterized membrane-anchored protein
MNGKKVAAQAVGAALAGITVWVLGSFAKVMVPAEVAVAFGTIFSVVVSILTPDSREAE